MLIARAVELKKEDNCNSWNYDVITRELLNITPSNLEAKKGLIAYIIRDSYNGDRDFSSSVLEFLSRWPSTAR